MRRYKNETIPQDELIEILLENFLLDNEEEIELFMRSHFIPKEWVPIEETNLLIGISPSGGMMKCCKCNCLWSLDYHCINIPNANNEEEMKDMIEIWQYNKTWHLCPCCSYESMRVE